jgi:hypothetical protein
VLQKVHADASRDQYTRDAAAAALAALGAPVAAAPAPEPEAAPAPTEAEVSPEAPAPVEAPADGAEAVPVAEDEPAVSEVPVPAAGRFAPDVLAASQRWTFVAGGLSLTWDSYDQPQLSGSAALAYQRGLEKPKLGYSFDAGLALAAGAQDRDGGLTDTASYALVFDGVAQSELRFYLAGERGPFLHAGASLRLAGSALKVESPLGEDQTDFTPSIDGGLALGAGWGRTLDVGARLRVQRLERVLARARLLGRPINDEVANRLVTAWWDLRGSLGLRRELVATIQILKEAGVLLTDPDPTTTYMLLQVLGDGQLDHRLSGWDVRLGIGELLVGRDDVGMEDEFDLRRQEVALAQGRYALQLAGASSELVATGRAVYRLGGDMEDPGYAAASADLAWRRYFYGEVYDPAGALEIGLTVAAADADLEADDAGASRSLGVRAGWRTFFSRASHLDVVGTLRLEADSLLLGVALSGTWGLSDVTYARW